MSPRRKTRPPASTGRLGDRPRAVERARDAQRDALRAGLDRAGRHDRVLLLQRIEQGLRRNAEGRELGVAELDEDPLVLHAVEVDLGDARHLQEPLAQPLGDLLQLRVVGAVAGQHVEDRIDVAVFVVDVRADEVAGQLAADVVELLAQLVEELRHLPGRRVVAEADIHRREAGLGVGDDLVEPGQLLQLLLDPVGRPGPASRCAVAPGQIAVTITFLMVKFGSSARPSERKERSPPTPIARMRNRTSAG